MTAYKHLQNDAQVCPMFKNLLSTTSVLQKTYFHTVFANQKESEGDFHFCKQQNCRSAYALQQQLEKHQPHSWPPAGKATPPCSLPRTTLHISAWRDQSSESCLWTPVLYLKLILGICLQDVLEGNCFFTLHHFHLWKVWWEHSTFREWGKSEIGLSFGKGCPKHKYCHICKSTI